jgi:hypothetical protein
MTPKKKKVALRSTLRKPAKLATTDNSQTPPAVISLPSIDQENDPEKSYDGYIVSPTRIRYEPAPYVISSPPTIRDLRRSGEWISPAKKNGRWDKHSLSINSNSFKVVRRPRLFKYIDWLAKVSPDDEELTDHATITYYEDLWCFEYDIDYNGSLKTLRIVTGWPTGSMQDDLDKFDKFLFPEGFASFLDYAVFPISIEYKNEQYSKAKYWLGVQLYESEWIEFNLYEQNPYGLLKIDKRLKKASDDKNPWTSWSLNCKKSVSAFFNSSKSANGGRIESLRDIYDTYKTRSPHEQIECFDDFKLCVEACKKASKSTGVTLIPTRKQKPTRKQRQ